MNESNRSRVSVETGEPQIVLLALVLSSFVCPPRLFPVWILQSRGNALSVADRAIDSIASGRRVYDRRYIVYAASAF